MRIVIVSLANGSDHQRYSAIVANAMAQEHSVFVICTGSYDVSLFNETVSVNNKLICHKTWVERQSLSIGTWVKIIKQIKTFNPDLIHFMTAHPLNLIISLSCITTYQLFTLHDVVPHPGEKISILVSGYNALVKRIADTIVVHSSLAMRQLGTFGKKTVLMPLGGVTGIDSMFKDGSSPDNILFFGRIRPYKGLDLFVGAAEKVIKEFPGVKFIIAGDGDMGNILTEIEQRPYFIVENRFISEGEVARFFSNCKLVVLPYRSATQSGIIPIAYSHGRPVIATNVGAIAEMVKHNETGLVVDPDIDSVAIAIERLLKDESLYKKLTKGVELEFLSNYTPTSMGMKFKKMYESFCPSNYTVVRSKG